MHNKIAHNQYKDLFLQIVAEIKGTQIFTAHKVNSSMIQMYWNIGKRISVEKMEKGYGSSVVKRLSGYLQQEFPDTTGFSSRNLWNIKNFYDFTHWQTKKCNAALHFYHGDITC